MEASACRGEWSGIALASRGERSRLVRTGTLDVPQRFLDGYELNLSVKSPATRATDRGRVGGDDVRQQAARETSQIGHGETSLSMSEVHPSPRRFDAMSLAITHPRREVA